MVGIEGMLGSGGKVTLGIAGIVGRLGSGGSVGLGSVGLGKFGREGKLGNCRR
jgi:hypothetical protein